MSGFEIGGLVLAVFPLVISAIEGDRKGLEVLRLWDARNYKAEIEAIGLEIEIQATIFRNSYLVLLQVFMDQRSLVRLLADPQAMQQSSAAITSNLKSYLGFQWEMYAKVMGRLHNTLTALRFNIEKNAEMNSDNWLSKVTSALKPIKFSFGVRNRKGLLQRIKDDNQTFLTLTEQKSALKDLEGVSTKREVVDLRGLRDRTTALFHAVMASIQCPDVNAHKHNMGLYLGSFVSQDDKENWQWFGSEASTSDIFLWMEGPGKESTQRVDIVCTDATVGTDFNSSLCEVLATVGLDESTPKAQPPRAVGGKVSQNPRNLQADAINSYHQSKLPGDKNRMNVESPHITFDLSDINSKLDLFHACQPGRNISLHEMLSGGLDYSRFPGYFFEKDRISLAIMISSSALSLHRSPWLNASLSCKAIYLEIKNDDIDERVLLRPYLKGMIPSKSVVHSAESPADLDKEAFGVRNRHLYNLGAIILELIMNKPLQYFQEVQRPSETEDEIAWWIERQVCSRSGPVWADIVSKCLHCPFPSDPDLEDDVFLAAVYAEVIEPLIEMTKLPTLRKLQKHRRNPASVILPSNSEHKDMLVRPYHYSPVPSNPVMERVPLPPNDKVHPRGITLPADVDRSQVTYPLPASSINDSESPPSITYPFRHLRDRSHE